jgi:ABC-type transporter MlaC component
VLVVRFLGERTTTYVGESSDGQWALVRTRLISEKDGEMPVEYRLSTVGGRWTLVDIVVDGVSLAANYRVQFTKIIRTSSYQTLLQRMRKRVE